MSEITEGVRRPLASAGVYSAIQRALGAEAVHRHLIDHHLRPIAGERLLDLGCGPGDILALLPPVTYTGVDISTRYIDAARRRFGDAGTFIRSDVSELEVPERSFDAVLAIGMLHHLDDRAVAGLAHLAAGALDLDGRLVTVDPARVLGQPRLARWLISRDRGQAVRTTQGYRELVRPEFGSVSTTVRHDLARIPYTHAILECRRPSEGSALSP